MAKKIRIGLLPQFSDKFTLKPRIGHFCRCQKTGFEFYFRSVLDHNWNDKNNDSGDGNSNNNNTFEVKIW